MTKQGFKVLVAGFLVFGSMRASASPLAIVTNNALQQIEIEVGPVNGEVRVYGVNNIPSGTLFTDVCELSLTTGLAQDYVEFRVLSEVVPSITLNTRAGISDVKFLYFTPDTLGTVSTSVVVQGGTANDTISFEVESLAAGFVADWQVLGSSGTNKLLASVKNLEPANLMSVNVNGDFLGGSDIVDVALLGDANQVILNLAALVRGGNDTVKVTLDQQAVGAVTATYSIDLGAGLDSADLTSNSPFGTIDATGTISGAAGDDQIKYSSEGSGSLNMTFNGANNNDVIDVFAKGNVTGNPILLGGLNNDNLKIVVDGPSSMNPLLDGGPGIDACQGFGTIINCEQ